MRVHEHEHERTNERFGTIFHVDITNNLFLFYFFSLPSRSLSRYRLTRVKIYVYWNDREYYLTGSHVTRAISLALRPTEGGINSAKFTKIKKKRWERSGYQREKKKKEEKEVQGSWLPLRVILSYVFLHIATDLVTIYTYVCKTLCNNRFISNGIIIA